MNSFRSLHVAFCFIALTVGACSLHSKGPGTGTEPETASEERFITETAKHAQAQFARGRFKRALELYSKAFEKHHHPGLRSGYARLGEQIKSAADTAYQTGNVAKAGSNYNILLESGITKQDFAETLSFDDNDLRKQIKDCSKALMENGLKKYREEKLDEAIAIWKKALFFDPDNRSVKNAFETASAQLQKLKQLK
jgi:tetratricopeptide (TPR) repeat protein